MLSDRQMTCLRALVDTIIPADDFPGGWESGVGEYLIRQLNSDLASQLTMYRIWLDMLDAEARAKNDKDFADLVLDERTALLESIENGRVKAVRALDPVACFALIVEHCTEGYYSDPGNGGNRDAVSWAMVGFEVTG